MKIKAIVHEAQEGDYWVEVPALPGCYTEVDTMDELDRMLRNAIEGWFDAMSLPEDKLDEQSKVYEVNL